MTKPNGLTKDERKIASDKALAIREKTFKLTVKVISWESGAANSLVVKAANKISSEEWSQYKKHQLEIPTASTTEKIKNRLNQTYESIAANGGFE